MSDRCEPPEELRGVHGRHWCKDHMSRVLLCFWVVAPSGARWEGVISPEQAFAAGRRYLAPVTPPAEVDALRAEASEWCQKVQLFEDRIHKLSAELAAAREVEQCARDFVAWVTAPANEFTDPENMLVCGEWHGLCAAIKDTP